MTNVPGGAAPGRGIEPEVCGALAGHPDAPAFAREVLRIHRRYATEIVAAYGLCPFLRDVDGGFGKFCVMLDPTPDAGRADEAARAAGTSVVHLVYPIARATAHEFEKFAAGLAALLKRSFAGPVLGASRPPVMAVFHPELSGDATTPHRLVGVLRRAPDPFVQLVPEGLHQGGTVFAGATEEIAPDPAQKNFDRLGGAALDRLLETLADIHRDRGAGYAHYPALLSGR